MSAPFPFETPRLEQSPSSESLSRVDPLPGLNLSVREKLLQTPLCSQKSLPLLRVFIGLESSQPERLKKESLPPSQDSEFSTIASLSEEQASILRVSSKKSPSSLLSGQNL
jgi:hypothetical protein